jgi:hypothetical protein
LRSALLAWSFAWWLVALLAGVKPYTPRFEM